MRKLATALVGLIAAAGIAGGAYTLHEESQPSTSGMVVYGQVSDKAWDQLMSEGWHGVQCDHQEALYPAGQSPCE